MRVLSVALHWSSEPPKLVTVEQWNGQSYEPALVCNVSAGCLEPHTGGSCIPCDVIGTEVCVATNDTFVSFFCMFDVSLLQSSLRPHPSLPHPSRSRIFLHMTRQQTLNFTGPGIAAPWNIVFTDFEIASNVSLFCVVGACSPPPLPFTSSSH